VAISSLSAVSGLHTANVRLHADRIGAVTLRVRLRDDDGAIAVIVALMMTVLLGFVAITVDLGAVYFERQQLQNGADAAALAVACHRGTTTADASLATSMAGANAQDGRSAAVVTALSGGQVKVDTSTLTADGSSSMPLTFAPVLGIATSTQHASATAACGYPTGGTASLPVIFSYCAFLEQTGGGLPSSTQPHDIYFDKGSATGCTGRSGNPVPGGFNWLKTDSGGCSTTTTLGKPAYSDPGKSISNGCDAASVDAIRGKTILLPLFEEAAGNGANAYYIPSGYAAFNVTGYFFGNKYSWNAACHQPDYCLSGYFLGFAGVDTAGFTYSPTAPNYGASAASLTG
jgi:Flp pilus assembly protein TadG